MKQLLKIVKCHFHHQISPKMKYSDTCTQNHIPAIYKNIQRGACLDEKVSCGLFLVLICFIISLYSVISIMLLHFIKNETPSSQSYSTHQ